MAQLIPVFIMGVLGAAVLLLLRHFNVRWAIYPLTIALFAFSSYAAATSDWRVTISNVASMAVLFFVPLVAVLHLPKLIHKPLVSGLAALAVGGVTALTFQYAGLGLATVLGIQ